ncbi:MAG: hypothetical protein ACTSRH_08100 [Promethearchaeota archaeon]
MILNFIYIHSKIFTKDLFLYLKEKNVGIKGGHFYRYLESLETYELIKKTGWIDEGARRGYCYIITDKGKKLLDFFKKNPEYISP